MAFHPNCTLPPAKVHFVSGPNVRGTLEILWNCLSILLLCSWSILHLNVPVQTCGREKRFGRMVYMTLRKLKWMMVTLLAPEIILAKSYMDLRSARSSQKAIERMVNSDETNWSLSHSFFADMGGFVIKFPVPEDLNRAAREDVGERSDLFPLNSTSTNVAGRSIPSRISADSSESFDSRISSTVYSDGIPLPVLPQEQKRFRSASPLSEPARLLSGSEPVEGRLQQAPEVTARRAKKIIKHLDDSLSGLPRYSSYVDNLSKRIGTIDWQVCERNKHKIRESVDTIALDHEPNAHLDWFENLCRLQGTRWAVDAIQLRYCLEVGIIEELPRLSEDELSDRSKGDFVAKAFALSQIVWLVTQTTVRAAKRLPISQLEIVVLAFSACAIITYGILWSKPQGVQTPTYLQACRYPEAHEIAEVAMRGPFNFWFTRREYWVPNSATHRTSKESNPGRAFVSISCVGAALFGAVHCLAWNFTFPSETQRLGGGYVRWSL